MSRPAPPTWGLDAPGQGPTSPAVSIAGLVERFHEPHPAGARTRRRAPGGYGVREQCLPFTAASALGLAVPAPFTWGCCELGAIPDGARSFRSPVRADFHEPRWFYVVDDQRLSLRANQFHLPHEVTARIGEAPVPALSFFDRPDKQRLVKVHLPYSWRTAAEYETLFVEAVNRPRADGLRVLAGLVETAWYTNPVNLVVQLPPSPAPVHVEAGSQLAQAILVPRASRRPQLEVLASHGGPTREQLDGVARWRQAHAADRSAYKRLARSREGRLEARS